MARISPQEILKRRDKADARKEEWRTIYEECYEFALPQRNLYDGYYEGKTPGQNKMHASLMRQPSTQRSGLPIAFNLHCFPRIVLGAH